MKKTESAGGVVIGKSGKVLVVNQHGDSWSLPKGHIEKGEDAFTAAKREIYEESGIKKLNFIREFPIYGRHRIGPGGKGEDVSSWTTIHMFLFTTSEEKLQPVDPENPEARWVPKGEVVTLLTHTKDKEFFLSIIGEL